MQRMIAIIRIVVRSNPIDAMRSSNIMVCVFCTTTSVERGLNWGSSMTRELLAKWKKLDYSASSRCLVGIEYVWSVQHAYLSCFYWGLFSICSESPPCPRDIFRPRIRKSQGHGFKARVGWYAFFVDFPVSGVVRAKSQRVKLWCNVKLSEDMPPRTSQWNFLLEN